MLQCLEVMHSNPLICPRSGESFRFFVGSTIDQLTNRSANVVHLCDLIKKVFPFCFLQVLEADNNLMENLEGINHLPRLEEVLLKNNSILSRRRCAVRRRSDAAASQRIVSVAGDSKVLRINTMKRPRREEGTELKVWRAQKTLQLGATNKAPPQRNSNQRCGFTLESVVSERGGETSRGCFFVAAFVSVRYLRPQTESEQYFL